MTPGQQLAGAVVHEPGSALGPRHTGRAKPGMGVDQALDVIVGMPAEIGK